ncbi:general substrate transporter [Paraphaeosphaeria sporulosa]|uniref:Quinate transporter n=1 Tax=Paraphaeosphaeria sporulosa TaxID=1460663 RepID=A0A177C1P1_9PLEO|nr:general substrate transporter [Paraphaeosphaeria sporulosa]OAG00718.1 general substrate transporter [Paraphaeosphaeria sporulosa]
MKSPFALKEDAYVHSDIPMEIHGTWPYILAFPAAWDSAFIGTTLALPSFKHRFGLDTVSPKELTNLSSKIVSTFQAGAFFGAIFGFLFAERWGRKITIMGGGALFMVGAGLMLHGTLGLYAECALTGPAIGATSTMIPIYIAECSPALIRGRLVGIFEIMLQIALVFGFWVNYAAAQFIPAGLLLISMPFIIESPRWLLSKNRISQATKALCWVRNLPAEHAYIVAEMEEILTAITHELEVSGGRRSTIRIFREIGAPGIRNRVLISVLLMLLQNLTGINAINYYRPTILKAIGYTRTSDGLLATGIYGLVKIITTLISMVFFVDRFGRRPALLVRGSFEGKTPARDSWSQAALGMIYIYAIFYGFSWNGIPWIFASEVLPTRVRTLGMWLAQLMVVYSLLQMIAGITYGTFIFFGSCMVVAFIFAYFFVPETKSRMVLLRVQFSRCRACETAAFSVAVLRQNHSGSDLTEQLDIFKTGEGDKVETLRDRSR